MQREEEIMQREREIRERDREHAERYHREQQQQQQQQQHHPVQSHTGSIPIHQPVASKVQNSIHGPNGLLSNLGATTGPNAPQSALQGSSVPGGLFGGQMQHPDGPPRQYMPVQSQSLLFGGNAPSQIPGSVAALAQGQQPILNSS
ncbi:LOW QUALITY PROTEIN: transcriptional repressor Sin3p [Coccidioides immitis H538.4]|uniref:Transcriptional repressor Sin3p n=1 Tax=Coccidioides immitis H538.4 TaxID=396776 RepID=A0A0J8RNM0_COCIT|nr:LOW QUALITY PROTEIN: transcriptional repressor Sin3p [Coccidioides immitis H538.4]